MAIEDLLHVVMEQLKSISKTETVVGEPITAGESVIVPVSKVSLGFGAGGGETPDEAKGKSGVGTGGGILIEPIAFVVVTRGKAQLISLREARDVFSKAIDLIPEVIEKISETLQKQKPPEEDEREGEEE